MTLDLSLAGKKQGMSVSQAVGGTRSGLLWEIERILEELSREREREHSTLPQCLLMENVEQIISKQNVNDFVKWTNKLESLGYTNHFKVLNAKDYGIPQNRKRCYMVSILGDYSYDFPLKLPLKYKLKDFLQSNVDEKYYLSDKMIKYIVADNDKWTGNNGAALVNRRTAKTINTAHGQRRCDASDYICDQLPENADLKKEINVLGNYSPSGHNASRIVDTDGLSPTVMENHGTITAIPIKNNTKKGYEIAKVGDGVNLASRMEKQRGNVQRESIQTLKTQMEVGVVVEDELKTDKTTEK